MAESSGKCRAGRYITQTSGYQAFIPSPLPPEPPIRLEDDLQALLSQADRALGRLDGSIQTLPHPDLFLAIVRARGRQGVPPRFEFIAT